jgi:hypothetical protein
MESNLQNFEDSVYVGFLTMLKAELDSNFTEYVMYNLVLNDDEPISLCLRLKGELNIYNFSVQDKTKIPALKCKDMTVGSHRTLRLTDRENVRWSPIYVLLRGYTEVKKKIVI